MKFPKRLRHRGKGRVLATIYARRDGYRLYWRVGPEKNRRSRMKDFSTYSEAKREGDKVVSDLNSKSPVTDLSRDQASKALAALEGLQRFYKTTGRQVSLLEAVEQCQRAVKTSQ